MFTRCKHLTMLTEKVQMRQKQDEPFVLPATSHQGEVTKSSLKLKDLGILIMQTVLLLEKQHVYHHTINLTK